MKKKIDWSRIDWQDILKESYVKNQKKVSKPGIFTSEFLVTGAVIAISEYALAVATQLGVAGDILKFAIPAVVGGLYVWLRSKYKWHMVQTDEAKKLAGNVDSLDNAIKKVKSLE